MWFNKMIWNKVALWCGWFLTARSFVVLACSEHGGLISHVGNSSGLPKPFPKDSHVRPVRYMFVQVVGGSAVFPGSHPLLVPVFPLRVTQGWQEVYCSLEAEPTVAVAAKTQPQRDNDLNLACWLLVSRLPGTTQFGEEQNIPGSIHV